MPQTGEGPRREPWAFAFACHGAGAALLQMPVPGNRLRAARGACATRSVTGVVTGRRAAPPVRGGTVA